MELRTILDWEVALPMRSVPGVIGVNSFGGELKTYRAEVNPERMLARDIPMGRVFEALRANNANAGGGYIQRNGEVRIIRGEGLIRDTEDMDRIVLDTTEDGTPIYVRDVGRSLTAPMIRRGAVTRDGQGEAVTAIVYMLIGSNTRLVVDRVEAEARRDPREAGADGRRDRRLLQPRRADRARPCTPSPRTWSSAASW